jgi:hypothetical protein
LLSSVVRRYASFFTPLVGCLALGWVVISSCGSNDNGLCSTLTGNADGIFLKDCPRGMVKLSGVSYQNGRMTSYAFVVTCPDKSAHGVFTQAGGLQCVDGAYPCNGDVCTPTSNADCAVLTNCIELGECGFQDGKCVLTEAGCSQSQIPCGISGACHLGPSGACTAISDDDCRTPFPGCPDCFKGACFTSGKCYAQNGACVARQDSDCKGSQECAFAGKCTLQGDECMAISDADCRSSEVCRTAGQCVAVAGSCQAP